MRPSLTAITALGILVVGHVTDVRAQDVPVGHLRRFGAGCHQVVNGQPASLRLGQDVVVGTRFRCPEGKELHIALPGSDEVVVYVFSRVLREVVVPLAQSGPGVSRRSVPARITQSDPVGPSSAGRRLAPELADAGPLLLGLFGGLKDRALLGGAAGGGVLGSARYAADLPLACDNIRARDHEPSTADRPSAEPSWPRVIGSATADQALVIVATANRRRLDGVVAWASDRVEACARRVDGIRADAVAGGILGKDVATELTVDRDNLKMLDLFCSRAARMVESFGAASPEALPAPAQQRLTTEIEAMRRSVRELQSLTSDYRTQVDSTSAASRPTVVDPDAP